MAERVGFEPTCPLLAGKTLSRRPRYDRFGTSPARSMNETRKSKLENRKSKSANFYLCDRRYFSPPFAEELAQNFCALIRPDAGYNLNLMIHFGVVEDCQG